MKRQNELNEKTLEKARKEEERIKKLYKNIQKAKFEIEKIKEQNCWIHSLNNDFDKDATTEQINEFFNELIDIR